MAALNQFQICGTAKTVESLTSNSGTQYTRLTIEVEAFRQGMKAMDAYDFAFFHEQGEVLQSQVAPGDLVLVTGKLDKNRNGYLDIRAQAFAVIRQAQRVASQGAQQQAPRVDPSDIPPMRRQPQYAAQRNATAQMPPADSQELDAVF